MADSQFKRSFVYTIPEHILFDNDLTLNDLKIYMIVRSFMDSTGTCFASNEWIAKKLGINERSVRRCIEKLVEKKYLERIVVNTQRYLMVKQNPLPDIDIPANRADTDDRGGGHNCPGGEDTNVHILDQRLLYKNYNKRDEKKSEKTNFKSYAQAAPISPSSFEVWSPQLQKRRNAQVEAVADPNDWRELELQKQLKKLTGG